MACFRPLYGWQTEPGAPLSFGAEPPNTRKVDIPCGYCLGCRLAKSKAWAVRCMHEAQTHRDNCFITLTYSQDNYRPGLNHADFRRFIRRVVAAKGKTRYFMCGEYGDKFQRPHYHAILFGQRFPDTKHTKAGGSEELERLWGMGFTSVDEANMETAAYIARYQVKKVYGLRASAYYTRVDMRTGEYVRVRPEYCAMSKGPAIGHEFLTRYWPEIYAARDGVVTKGGATLKAPRYYDEWLERNHGKLREEKNIERTEKLRLYEKDNTDERLQTRELIAYENIKRKTRQLE